MRHGKRSSKADGRSRRNNHHKAARLCRLGRAWGAKTGRTRRIFGTGSTARMPGCALLPEAKFLDDGAIALDLGGFQIVEQSAPLAHHLEESAARVVVSGVNLEMLGEVADLLREESDLHLRRARVRLVQAE